jgi:UDP-N-acetylmuramate dehydrogenase
MAAADCGFGYRSSVFKRQAAAAGRGSALNPASATGRFVILAVTFRLPVSPLSAPVRYGELSRVLGIADGGRVPLAAARAAVLELRRGKGMVLADADPDTRSAGSFFMNPVVSAAQYGELATRIAGGQAAGGEAGGRGAGVDPGMPHWPASDGQVKLSAAWLIEHAGFSKGWRLPGDPDGARISAKHALALTNPGQATTASLIRLAQEIRAGVLDSFGVTLTNEPVLVGVEL